MGTFIFRRLLQALLVIVIVSILIFFAIRFLPGDPLLIFISQSDIQGLTNVEMAALRHEFGLDKSIPLQYLEWLGGMLRGDFGTSIVYYDKVSVLIKERLPVTIHLGILSLVLSSFFGILMGAIAAIRRGEWLDTLMTSLSNIGITVPVFWLGVILIYIFGLKLNWLPIQGYTSPFEDFWLSTRKLIMPVICLSIHSMTSMSRQTRSSVLEVVGQDYIRTAWSKGLTEKDVIWRHTLKNSIIPVVTLIGVQLAQTFGGTILIETVFNIPGMGRLMVNAVFAQDYPLVQAGCIVISTVVVLVNLLVDISYGWLDPRIRYR